MINCEAFSASACEFTLEHNLTSNQVGGGCEGDKAEGVDGRAIDSRWAMAESRVGRTVTECQDEPQDVSDCVMKFRSSDMRWWRADVPKRRNWTSLAAARWTWIIEMR
jgi:hypothetical protein